MNTRLIDAVVLLKNCCLEIEDEIITRFSISPSEYRALLEIKPGEILTGKIYSARMNLSVSRGSRVIEGLIKNKLLKHEDFTDDRRCNMVSLTNIGIKIRKEIDEMLDECENEIFDKVPETEFMDIKTSISKLTDILKIK
jgi:DNA-binding MarR family transcriptional regulator